MYIISKHKDYYDGVVGTTGIDKSIIYERHEVSTDKRDEFPSFYTRDSWKEMRDNPLDRMNYIRLKSDKYEDYSLFVVGFCGKLYLGWKLLYKNEFNGVDEFDVSYDRDEIESYFTIEKNFEIKLDNLYNYINNYDALDIFRKYNTPVFLMDLNSTIKRYHRKEEFIINPILKNYEFYKVFETFTAFQEISMFIGGVLGSGEKDIIEISDKHKIAKHGFDKWSFRKEPKNK